jgi:hypothetical protein
MDCLEGVGADWAMPAVVTLSGTALISVCRMGLAHPAMTAANRPTATIARNNRKRAPQTQNHPASLFAIMVNIPLAKP